VHARISDALTDVGIVGRWALVAEVIDMDGRTSVLTVPAPGLAAWECMGLHGHAQALAKEASIQ
jgi:hypothetical protein